MHQYESDDVSRCHVLILDKYVSKLPREGKVKDIFYMKPKAVAPKDLTLPWFYAVPEGRNTLAEMMKRISTEGKLNKEYTNHSL